MDVEVLAGDDWKILKDVRLRALEDSPAAFLSTYQADASLAEAEWRARCLADAWVVARSGHQVVGVACSVRVTDRPADERHLESVWVDPLHRREGVLRAILNYLADLQPDVRSWLAWVLDGNDEARTVYERLGFETTGERQLLTGTSDRSEERLKLDCATHFNDPDEPRSVP